jgi:AraC-like DNA-binding protein
MMMTYSLSALAPQRSRRAAGLFSDHIVDLLGLGIAELGGETRTRAPEITIDLIQDFVRMNSRDHALSAAAVARAFGLSERYVHKLFQKGGQTFSEFLCGVRLDECAAALAQPGSARPAVAALAFEAGFSDLSYFNRRFKSRFAATPSEYRRRYQMP